MTAKQELTGSDVWVIFAVGACQMIVAWVMAAWQAVYPPIPMFLAAVLAGMLLRGRPQAAARSGLIAGLAFGWVGELAYSLVRSTRPATGWQGMQPGELIGLVLAETVLYAALLGFFAAFIAWGGTRPKFAAGEPEAEEDVLHKAVPFNPAPLEPEPPRTHPASKK